MLANSLKPSANAIEKAVEMFAVLLVVEMMA